METEEKGYHLSRRQLIKAGGLTAVGLTYTAPLIESLCPATALAAMSGKPGAPPCPKYEPDVWNDVKAPDKCTGRKAGETRAQWIARQPKVVQCRNNCYNYACNIITNTFAQPGAASGKEPANVTCDDYTKPGFGALADGLTRPPKPTDITSPCPDGWCKIALVIWENEDYHWYRLDSDTGRWSHKRGQRPATDREDFPGSNKQITDPSDPKTDTGPYKFCSFFCVRKDMANIA